MPDDVPAAVNASRARVIAGLAGLLGGATLMVPTPDPDQSHFLAFNTANVVAFVLLVITVVGLWRLGVVGRSRLGHIGLAMASVALLGFAVVEYATRYEPSIGELMHPVLVPMSALGMTAAGIAVIRAGRWAGWGRITPLLCGVAPLAIEFPVVVVFGPIGWVIVLMWVTWVVLGLALLSTPIGAGAAEPALRSRALSGGTNRND